MDISACKKDTCHVKIRRGTMQRGFAMATDDGIASQVTVEAEFQRDVSEDDGR